VKGCLRNVASNRAAARAAIPSQHPPRADASAIGSPNRGHSVTREMPCWTCHLSSSGHGRRWTIRHTRVRW